LPNLGLPPSPTGYIAPPLFPHLILIPFPIAPVRVLPCLTSSDIATFPHAAYSSPRWWRQYIPQASFYFSETTLWACILEQPAGFTNFVMALTRFSIHSHESNQVPQITLAALVSARTGVGVFLVHKVLLHSLYWREHSWNCVRCSFYLYKTTYQYTQQHSIYYMKWISQNIWLHKCTHVATSGSLSTQHPLLPTIPPEIISHWFRNVATC
jgi:hypothetical protein